MPKKHCVCGHPADYHDRDGFCCGDPSTFKAVGPRGLSTCDCREFREVASQEELRGMYIAHDITASSGGRILGVFSTYQRAKNILKAMCRFEEQCTDWGYFIRYLEVDKPLAGVLSLPRTDKDGKPVQVKVEYVLGVQIVDGHVIATGG